MKATHQLAPTGPNQVWAVWGSRQPTSMTAIEMLRSIADFDAPGEPLPVAVLNWLKAGARLYFAGKNDLTKNLGLRPKRGHRPPAKVARLAERDAMIRLVFDARPEKTPTERAKATARLMQDDWKNRISEADFVAGLIRLHAEFGTELPATWRRIFDIANEGT